MSLMDSSHSLPNCEANSNLTCFMFLLTTILGRYNYCWRYHLTITISHILGSSSVRQWYSYTLNLTLFSFNFISIWSFYVPLFGTLINLGVLYWKRHSHPWNLVLLSTFTLMEAFTLGVTVAFFNNIIVLQALCVLYLFPHSIIHLNSQGDHAWRLYWSDSIHSPI
jgi:hypothetical protein